MNARERARNLLSCGDVGQIHDQVERVAVLPLDLQPVAGVDVDRNPPCGHAVAGTILNQFEDEVVAAVGASPDALLASLWSLSIHWMRAGRENPLVLIQISKTGYEPISASGEKYDEFIAAHAKYVAIWWSQVREETITEAEASEIFKGALAAMTYTEEKIAEISLSDRLPFRAVIPAEFDDRLFLDHAAADQFLSDLFREIGFVEGARANVKGANFEREVARQAREAGLVVWEEGKDLIPLEGDQREIDVGIVIGDTLYAIECKAFAQHPLIDRGDYAKLQGRRDNLVTYLARAATLADFLRENRTGRNYAVPDEIQSVEHLLCTPGVEWIWSSSDPTLWLEQPRMPRICLVEEMLNLLSGREEDPVTYPGAAASEPST